jgi:hypothetical protein
MLRNSFVPSKKKAVEIYYIGICVSWISSNGWERETFPRPLNGQGYIPLFSDNFILKTRSCKETALSTALEK